MVSPKKTETTYELYFLTVQTFNASTHSALNYDAVKSANKHSDKTPVFQHYPQLSFECTCFYPNDRAGDIFNVTIYGHEQQPELTLDDCLVLDENNRPKKQTRRGVSYPVHKLPPGTGFIEKVRAQEAWSITCWTPPATVAHMIAILSMNKQCYLYVDEVKIERYRAVRAIDLQTNKPE